ncbi:hypothetical protein BDZ89DRAFT_1068751 [Hymenopellis radicata]|nr:hypothetical protein BDZ89DRAFT_1068751 [Hymenopellis radicata]
MTLIFFFLNLCLFIGFTVISAIRYILWPDIWSIMIRNPVQSLFIGTFPMGATTLLNIAVSLINSQYGFGGKPFLYVLWALWWLDSAISVLCCWGVLHYMSVQPSRPHDPYTLLEAMTAAWLLPVVTLIVGSSSGGVFAPELHKYSAEHALITTSVSVFMVSIGLSLALMMLTIYLFRLIVHGLPPPASIVSVFLPLGPTGQAGYSILLTGQYFRGALPFGSSAFLGSQGTGHAIYAMCVGISFVLWCLCSMWTVFALLSVQHVARRSTIPFKVQTWGLIFPNGVYANLTLSMGRTFDSDFFRVFGSIYAAATLIMWIFVAWKTVILAYSKQIFEAPCLEALNMAAKEPIQMDSVPTENGTRNSTSSL